MEGAAVVCAVHTIAICVCVRACVHIPAACLASRRWMRRCVKVSRPRRAELLNVVPRHSSGIDCRIAPMNGWNNPGRPAPAAPTPPLPCELILCGSLCNFSQTTTLRQGTKNSCRVCDSALVKIGGGWIDVGGCTCAV